MNSETPQQNLTNETFIEQIETSEAETSNGLENFGLQEEGSFGLFDDKNETQIH